MLSVDKVTSANGDTTKDAHFLQSHKPHTQSKADLAATKPANKTNNGATLMVNPTSNNILARLMVKLDVRMIISTGAIAVTVGCLPYGLSVAFQSYQLKQSTQAQLRSFSRAEYEQLRIGMSLTDVRAILNPGVETSRSATMATFVWENPDGFKITAIFESDLLKSKEQNGLK